MTISASFDQLFSLEPKPGLEKPVISPKYDPSSLNFLEGIHRRKSEALKSIVETQGWPDTQNYGPHSEAEAFMVIQHADYDLEFQKHCHALLIESVTQGRTVNFGYLAFLTDRILCNEGHHQRFGTQIREVTNGSFVPKPLEEPEAVDELRNLAGIHEPLSEYLQRINDGDLQFYRFVLHGYAEELEHDYDPKVIPFPKQVN